MPASATVDAGVFHVVIVGEHRKPVVLGPFRDIDAATTVLQSEDLMAYADDMLDAYVQEHTIELVELSLSARLRNEALTDKATGHWRKGLITDHEYAACLASITATGTF